ncbi:MmgE/PrpD family protein [Ornithinimicrobium cavernae]|uniref:MmgE/PrpD family protein n=1 Tax=Ornithinimicrobium cavernae TaxID=2666047 RepID=UPI000D6878AB|nr:MmgE/PrpD family protein [Ornithinimicrobium cavernae]
MTGYTHYLAEHVQGRAPQDRSRALDLAERAVVDTIAASLAARRDLTLTTGLASVGTGSAGPATLWTTGGGTDAQHAALLNGLAGHALDYDDVDDAMIGHPSTVLLPALLAVGEERDLSGEEILEAFDVGLFACRDLAAELGITGHYAKGWHATGTVGTVGATAGLARLMGLDLAQTRHALGIAGSLAGGSRQNFGTMTKPLHAGVAARSAVLAASLAAGGFTADPDQLEGPLGFLALHHGVGRTSRELPPGADAAGLNVKLYPCCYYLHCAADAALELRQEGLSADQVADVTVTVMPGGLAPLIHSRPVSGLQGKFSMEYAMAAALLDGHLILDSFTDGQVGRPEAQALLRKVTKREDPTPPVGGPASGAFAVVQVRTTSGDVLTRRVDRARGHASRPVDEADLRAKFDDCLTFVGLDQALGGSAYESLRHLRGATSLREALSPLRALVTGPDRATVGSR